MVEITETLYARDREAWATYDQAVEEALCFRMDRLHHQTDRRREALHEVYTQKKHKTLVQP